MQKSLILSHTHSQKNDGDGTQSERTLEPKDIGKKVKYPTLGSEMSNGDDEVAQLNRKVQMREALSERNPSSGNAKNMSFIKNASAYHGPLQALGSIADAVPGAVHTQPIRVGTNQSSIGKEGKDTERSHRDRSDPQAQRHEHSAASGSYYHQAIVPRPLTQYSESQITMTTNTNKYGGADERHNQ